MHPEAFHTLDPTARRAYLDGLTAQELRTSLPLVVAAVTDEEPGVSQAAMDRLIDLGGPAVVTALLPLFEGTPTVRNRATEVFTALLPDHLSAAQALVASPSIAVRALVAIMLGQQPNLQASPLLVTLTTDPAPLVRAYAAEALGRLGARHAATALLPLLNDDEWVALSAITALATLRVADALPHLLPFLTVEGSPLQLAAIEALASVDETGQTVPLLLDLFPISPLPLQGALVRTLVSLRPTHSPDFWTTVDRTNWVPALLRLLDYDKVQAANAVMTALAAFSDHHGADALLAFAHRHRATLATYQDELITALSRSGDLPQLLDALRPDLSAEPVTQVVIHALARLHAMDAIPHLAGLLTTSTNPAIRLQCLAALGRLGTPMALRAILPAVTDPTGYVRQAAVHVLGAHQSQDLVPSLLQGLETERYADTRTVMVQTLAQLSPHSVSEAVPRLCQHARALVRHSAAQLLGLLPLPEGLPWLIRLCQDPDHTVRAMALLSLTAYPVLPAEPMLLLGLADEEIDVRLAAIRSLTSLHPTTAAEALLACSQHDADVAVQGAAIEGLGRLRSDSAVPVLSARLTQGTLPAILVRSILTALGQIGDPTALPQVTRFLDHPDRTIRLIADRTRTTLQPSLAPGNQDPIDSTREPPTLKTEASTDSI